MTEYQVSVALGARFMHQSRNSLFESVCPLKLSQHCFSTRKVKALHLLLTCVNTIPTGVYNKESKNFVQPGESPNRALRSVI